MKKDIVEFLKYFLLFLGILIVVYFAFTNTDWNNICNSWLRYSKAYWTTCLLKGY